VKNKVTTKKYGAKIINFWDYSPFEMLFFRILHLLNINIEENATKSIMIYANLQPICKQNGLPLQRKN
jgi:hypothetical protein